MTNDQILAEHRNDKLRSTEFKERRFQQWNENYLLYRDKIITNRLAQRQAVNIPIVRESIQTWISKIDEPPMLTFESRTRDNRSRDGEIILNELWSYNFDRLKLDVLDNLDKKVVGLQGRSFKKAGFSKGQFFLDVLDPYDIDIDPFVNPLDLETASFVTHRNIFRPLRTILANPKYEAEGKRTLKTYLASKQGLLQATETRDEWDKRNKRLEALGAQNIDDFFATDTLVELNEDYKLLWNATEGRFVRHLIVTGADQAVLYNKPLKTAIGIERVPLVSWADDPDLSDFWCDGKADSVRTINKVVNVYFSQDLENRAYRNFGMYFFDTMGGKFTPQAFDPKPFGMYGVPGNPNDLIRPVEVPDLGDTTGQMQYLKDLVQSSIAQTPTERGIATNKGTTLGEVQLNLQQSQTRNEVTAKNYRRAWKEVGTLFYELINANSSGQMTLYKKGSDGEYRAKTVMPTDWQNPAGYECKVVLKSEKEADDTLALQKVGYVRANFAENPVALKIAKRKELELLGWTPEEIEEAMQFEEEAMTPQEAPGAALPPNLTTDAPADPNAPQAPGMGATEPVLSPLQPNELAA